MIHQLEAIRRTIEFIKRKDFRKPILIFHADHDGASGAAILWSTLTSLHGNCTVEYLPVICPPYYITSEMVRRVNRSSSDSVVILDLPVERKPSYIDLLHTETKTSIFIYDHHLPTVRVPHKEHLLYVNPRESNEKSALPTAYFAFKVHQACKISRDVCWLAAIGAYGDKYLHLLPDLVDEVQIHWPHILQSLESLPASDSWPVLEELVRKINSARISTRSSRWMVRQLIEATKGEGPDRILTNAQVKKRLDDLVRKKQGLIDREIELASYRSKKLCGTKIVLYKVDKAKHLSGIVASSLAKSNPSSLVITYYKRGQKVIFEIRSGSSIASDINIGSLVANALKDLKCSVGGGHERAGGGELLASQFSRFLSSLEHHLSLE